MSVRKKSLPCSCEIKQSLGLVEYLEANVFDLFTVTRLALDVAAPLKLTLAPLLDNRHNWLESPSTAQFGTAAMTIDVSFAFSTSGS